jgi:hypothetical protein
MYRAKGINAENCIKMCNRKNVAGKETGGNEKREKNI